MTSVQLKDIKGKAVGEAKLEDSVFGIEPNTAVLHQALHRQLANARAGTASTKTRAEVRGGGRKPWRQKGTGRARVGSIRSPLWAGGGVTFGPKPRDYSQSMPKKVRQLALKSALASRKDHLTVVESFDGLFKTPPSKGVDTGEQPKTKDFNALLKALGLNDKCVLLMLDLAAPDTTRVERAARNLANVRVIHAQNLNVKDILESEAVLISQQTLGVLNNRFNAQPEENKAAKKAAKAEKSAKAEPAKKATKTTKSKAESGKAAEKQPKKTSKKAAK